MFSDYDEEELASSSQTSSINETLHLCCSILTEIVGVQYYNGRVGIHERVQLIRDPNNRFDKNAIKVCNTYGQQIGHVKREVASIFASLMDAHRVVFDATVDGNPRVHTVPISIDVLTSRLADLHSLKGILQRVPQRVSSAKRDSMESRSSPSAKRVRSSPSSSSSSIAAGYNATQNKVQMETVSVANIDYEKITENAWSEGDLLALVEHEQPKGLTSNLLAYQKQGLGWMIASENPRLPKDPKDVTQFWSFDPSNRLYTNMATQFSTLEAPSFFRGGILADDMGLGKTLQSLSLIQWDLENDNKGERRPTLIVCPVAVIANWCGQIDLHFSSETIEAPSYQVLHGYRKEEALRNLETTDVTFTTYGTLASLFKSAQKTSNPIFSMNWRRIVLDEAHLIRSKKTSMAQACFALKAERRWCLTGTPIQNQVGDIYSLLNFLQFRPFCDQAWFTNLVSRPVSQRSSQGFSVLKTILRYSCLRRLKTMKLGGNSILELPKSQYFVCPVDMSSDERLKYDALEKESRDLYRYAVQTNSLQTQYPHIYEILIRMRQICDHVSLLKNRRIDVAVAALPDDIAKNPEKLLLARKLYGILIASENNEDCCVCLERLSENHAVITECAHIYCEPCIDQVIKIQHKCPMCRTPLDASKVLRSPPPIIDADEDDEDESDDDEECINNVDVSPSSKILALLKLIAGIEEKSPGDKIVIFSQWTSMLDIVQKFLTNHVRYDGSMSRAQRDRVVAQFQDVGSQTKIMLMSLKAGSLGLTLTCANHLILLDPWYNPAVEQQAIDRVYRIGQTKPVSIYRLVMRKSIEERILDLQEKKREIHRNAFKEEASSKSKQARLDNIRALIGSLEEDGDDISDSDA